MEHQVGQAQRDGAVERPLEPFEPLGAVGRVAEAAGRLDRLRAWCSPRRGTRASRRSCVRPDGERGLGHGVALVPARVVRVAAGDLGDVHARGRRAAASARRRS